MIGAIVGLAGCVDCGGGMSTAEVDECEAAVERLQACFSTPGRLIQMRGRLEERVVREGIELQQRIDAQRAAEAREDFLLGQPITGEHAVGHESLDAVLRLSGRE